MLDSRVWNEDDHDRENDENSCEPFNYTNEQTEFKERKGQTKNKTMSMIDHNAAAVSVATTNEYMCIGSSKLVATSC